MNDQDFLHVFETGTLPNDAFRHPDHIRMAWLYLRRDGWEVGSRNIRDGLRRFAAHHGHAAMYHETITLFWAHLVNHAITIAPEIDNFDAYIERFAHLLDKSLMLRHYSRDMLHSDAARAAWVEPDLLPFPFGSPQV